MFVLSAEIVVEARVVKLADFAVLEIGHFDMKLVVSFVLASFETVVKLVVTSALAAVKLAVMELEGSENLVEYTVVEADPDKLVQ